MGGARRAATATAIAVGLLPGCATEHGCPAQPTPHAEVVTLAASDGRVLSSRPTAYAYGPLVVRSGVLTDERTARAVAHLDDTIPTVPRSQVTNGADGYSLVGPGPRPWRLAGAAGTYVTTVAGVVVVLGKDSQLRGVQLRNGRPEWNARLDHRLLTTLAVAHGSVVLGAGSALIGTPADRSDRRVYAVDARTGEVRWTRPTAAGLDTSQIALLGHQVVVAAGARSPEGRARLSSLSAASGAPAWSKDLPRAVVASLGTSTGHLVTLNQDYVAGCG